MMLFLSKYNIVFHPNYVRFDITFYSKVYLDSVGWDSVLLKGKTFTWLERISMFSEEFFPFLKFTGLESLLFLCFFIQVYAFYFINSCDCFITVLQIFYEMPHGVWDCCFSAQCALNLYFFICTIRFFWARSRGLYLHWNWMLGSYFPEQCKGNPSVSWKLIPSFFFLDNFDMGVPLERIQQLIYLGVLGCSCAACFSNQSLLPPHCFLAKVWKMSPRFPRALSTQRAVVYCTVLNWKSSTYSFY